MGGGGGSPMCTRHLTSSSQSPLCARADSLAAAAAAAGAGELSLLRYAIAGLIDASAALGRDPALRAELAVGETVILLHPPLTLVGVSIAMERGRQQNDSLADG